MANKSFNLTKVVGKSFSLVVSSFTLSDSWFHNFRQYVNLSFDASLITDVPVNIITRGAFLLISKFSLQEQPSITITNRPASFAITVSEILEFLSLAISQISSVTYVVYETLSASATVENFSFVNTFSPILAEFLTLGDWDASTLGTMQGTGTGTLADIDYTT